LEYHLSIVIPVYNEAKRIGSSLERLLDYLNRQNYTREIILVDDGSTDDGIAIATALLKEREVFRVIEYGGNRGKGYALQQGIIATNGRYVLFTDADLSTPIEELDKMWQWLETGFEVVQGSRKMKGARVERHQPWLRENMGKVFTSLCNLLLAVNISDVTCGFKAYQGSAARQLYATQQLPDWSFDAEIIFLAKKWGYRIKEVPVRWHDEQGTKVNLVRDSLRSLQGIMRIRLNDFKHYYHQPFAEVSTRDSQETEVR
jgi:dolichyl-phosphate beta-glucosyltransferase